MALGLAGRLRLAWGALMGAPAGVPWHVLRDTRTGAPAVTPQTALTLPAVLRACSLLSEAASTAPPALYRREPSGGRVQVRDTPAARALAAMSHPHLELMAWSTALTGNGFARIVDADAGEFDLVAVAPWRVQLEVERGTHRVWYRIGADPDLDEKEVVLPERMVVHARYRATGSVYWGVPPIAACAPAFAAALATREAQMALMRNVAAPRVVLVTPNKIDPAIAKRLQTEFSENYSADGLGKPAVLANGLEAKPLNVSAVDMQLLETSQSQIADVARAFGLPQQFLEGDTKLSYASAAEGTRALYSLALRQFCARIGDAFAQRLLTRDERAQGATVEYDLSSLLVLPGSEMAEMLSKLANAGLATPNELRNEYLRMPDVEGGNVLRVPVNSMPADKWATAADAAALVDAAKAVLQDSSDLGHRLQECRQRVADWDATVGDLELWRGALQVREMELDARMHGTPTQ